jgi:2-polyprenyl-6-hydroxyphenyl methylase / 3-demethylubiquinone-9 3-methyltransferase
VALGHLDKNLGRGCGGGFLAEEFARLGFDVVGVDPSAVSIEAARAHAAASSLNIDYRVGAGEQLLVEDGMFDVAYCCDVLEHVSDLDRVISETARVLKPGGLYLFDTVNRTLQSKLVAIKIAQEWPLTRVVDTPMHDWQMFIKPRRADPYAAPSRAAPRRDRGPWTTGEDAQRCSAVSSAPARGGSPTVSAAAEWTSAG